MKASMKIFVFVFGVFWVLSGQAKSCCICQTGSWPSYQVPFFAVGCVQWLTKQKDCSEKKILPFDENQLELPHRCQNTVVNLGYIGHWEGSIKMARFLISAVFPAMKKNNVSVEIDNTACMAMQTPSVLVETVKAYRAEMAPNYLRVGGNQTLSIGMWDDYFWGQGNSTAIYDSRFKNVVVYRQCSEMVGRNCSPLAANEGYDLSMTCREADYLQTQSLTCCQIENASGPMPWRWWPEHRCRVKALVRR